MSAATSSDTNSKLASPTASNPWQEAWQRLSKNRVAVVSAALLLTILFSCLILPFTGALADPNATSLYDRNLSFGKQGTLQNQEHTYLFGSDHLGRDILSRTIYGGRLSLLVGIITALVSVTIGTFYGAIAGYASSKTRSIMMRLVDILYALPFLVIVILVSKYLTDSTNELSEKLVTNLAGMFKNKQEAIANISPIVSLLPLFLAIGMLSWLSISRIIMASVLGQSKMEYVDAARSLGLSNSKILLRHILPNIMGPVIVYTTLTIPSIMLFEASLSFLGVGVKAPNASWGSLIKEGAESMLFNPHLLLVPSTCFIITLLSLNFIGDGLRDALDVRASKD